MTHAKSSTKAPKRQYSSARRSQQAAETRAVVLDAARTLFAEKGWSATGMRDVARSAGVSVETVYGNFGSKTDLLLATIDIAVVGDHEPVALAERSEFAALGRGDLRERAAAGARLTRAVYERTYALNRALDEGAHANADLAARVRDAEKRRRKNVEQAATLVAGRKLSKVEYDGLWALASPQVYGLLTERAGWTAQQYESWLTDAFVRLAPEKEAT